LLIHCQYLKIFYKRSQTEDVPITRKIKLTINTISRSEDPTGGVGIAVTCTQPFFQGLNVDQSLKRHCQHRGPEFRHAKKFFSSKKLFYAQNLMILPDLTRNHETLSNDIMRF
jgi:hypothetical protein